MAAATARVGKKLVFFGAPGVGKGTYAGRIAPKLGIPTISTGDIVRAEIKAGSELGAKVQVSLAAAGGARVTLPRCAFARPPQEFNDKGQLVPDEIVTAMVKKRLAEPDAAEGYILDGYPRTLQQARDLAEFQDVDCVVNLSLPDDILVAKLLGRRMCADCGKNYNVTEIKEPGYEMPPLLPKPADCDTCKGQPKLVSRQDDVEEVIRDRLAVYKKETLPLVGFYSEQGKVLDFEVKQGLADMPRLLDSMGVQEAR